MKIVLIHGDNKSKAQERVRAIVDGVRKKGWKIERMDKKALLANVFMSNTLLPEDKLGIFDGVNNLSAENIEWLRQNAPQAEGSLLIIHNGDAPKKPLQPFKKYLTEEYFTYPQLLFKYLETLSPGKSPAAIRMLHELTETESIELVVAMMGRHFRDLYWVKTDPESVVYQDWRKKKLLTQANTFPITKLETIIAALASADYEAKSGGINLNTSLDLILVRELS